MTAEGSTRRVAAVTAAGAGIGQATALTFARRGFAVVAADIAEDGLCATAEQIARDGGDAASVVADVTTAAGAASVVEAAMASFGRLDALANVVGGTRVRHDLLHTTEEEWDFAVALNLTSVFQMSKHALEPMLRQGRGAIVNVASNAGVYGMHENPSYCAAKGAVIALTRALALDYGSRGVRVNCVSPGAILTPLMERNRTPEEQAQIAGVAAMRRLGRAEEIAQVIVYLAGDEASYVNGQSVSVDGGFNPGV